MKIKRNIGVISVNALALIISVILIMPLLLILLNAFKTNREAAAMSLVFPASLQWDNFLVVIEKGKLGIAFFNSMIYSMFAVLLTTLLASMAAYVFARNRRKLHNFFYFFIVLGITMPINFVTLTKVTQILYLINTRAGIVLLYAAIQMPFNVFLIHSFIGKIPRDIDEAGVIDGCSPLRLYISVVLPLLKPVLITVMVLTFLNTWNEFVLPLYFLGSSGKWPMTLAVYNFFGMYFKEWNLVCADIVLTSLPVILVYLAGQKYIVSGMTAGAVKA